MRIPLAVLIAALLLAPGCTDSKATAEATAKDLLEVAQAEATAWDTGARLVMAIGVEVRTTADLGEEDDAVEAAMFEVADSTPGDGRAPRWLYQFRNAAGDEELAVVVAAGGAVVLRQSTEHWDWFGGATVRIQDWLIDSDEAAAIAARADANFTALAQEDDAQFFSVLIGVGEAGTPWWMVGVENGEDETFILVNATNGEIESEEEFAVQVGIRGGAFGGFSGQVTLIASQSTEFEVPAGAAMGAIALRLETGAPLTVLRATVTEADGTVDELEVTNGVSIDGAHVHAILPRPPGGTYSVTVEVEAGVIAEFAFHYCVGGTFVAVTGAATGNLACRALLE